jgi:hypothetical protein
MRLARALLLIATVLPSGCIGTPACVDDGSTRLGIAEARLPKVSGVRVDGVCVLEPLPTACGPGIVCYKSTGGETIATVLVSASKQGTCTVTIEYNDGCASDELQFEFGGPMGNCCGEVCAKSLNTEPIPASCPPN